MKKTVYKLLATLVFIGFFAIQSVGQPPPPGHGADDDQPAPIGSGLVILLALGAAYGAKKTSSVPFPHKRQKRSD